MKRILAAATLVFLSGIPAVAAPLSAPCLEAGPTAVLCDPVNAGNPMPVGGGVAPGAADSGNPVKVGGVFMATQPTLTDGQRGDAQLGSRGSLRVELFGASSTQGANFAAGGGDGVSNTSGVGGPITYSRENLFNGSTWDRFFTCPNTAIVNVTAAATTEIVPLTASQTIRVCSVAISMSAAGTAKFLSGTGTNCGTGAADVTGAMPLATGMPLAISSGSGSVLRAPVANALCVAAVTGNVVGFVTYAKF